MPTRSCGRSSSDSPEGLGLLLIDIDNLKITNDTLGHAVGDELIRQVAHRIAKTVEPGTACRIGGDEFIAILDDCRPADPLRRMAQCVLASMEAPFRCEGHTIVPHVTIGGALYGRDGTDVDTLRQNADLALYDFKEHGRGHFVEYSARLRIAMTRRMQRINEVEAALNQGRLVAHYQPVVRLDTREIVGVEALARLVADDGGVVAAGYFQEALSDPRVSRRLTDRMLAQVAADLCSWLDMGIPFQHVGVNVSMADFQYGDFAGRIAKAFEGRETLLNHVVLEVTETVLVGPSDSVVAPAVDQLRGMGLRVALDDFGTGYASLTHLLTLPVDIIKIDKSFVDRLVGDTTGGVIVGALVDIATKLGMRIVAEGIETAEQADCLQTLGCVLGQGFLYHRAASFEETTHRLLSDAQGLRHGKGFAGRSFPPCRLTLQTTCVSIADYRHDDRSGFGIRPVVASRDARAIPSGGNICLDRDDGSCRCAGATGGRRAGVRRKAAPQLHRNHDHRGPAGPGRPGHGRGADRFRRTTGPRVQRRQSADRPLDRLGHRLRLNPAGGDSRQHRRGLDRPADRPHPDPCQLASAAVGGQDRAVARLRVRTARLLILRL